MKANYLEEDFSVVNVRLVKEPFMLSEKKVRTSADAVEFISDYLSGCDREVLCVINFSSDGRPISVNVVSIGTINASLVSPREVFKSSILSNAAGIIVAHCHPSGNVKPSRDDAVVTEKLRDAGDLLDIKLIDHIIVGGGTGEVFSFIDNDMFYGDVVSKIVSHW